jgi:hypothetical protein
MKSRGILLRENKNPVLSKNKPSSHFTWPGRPEYPHSRVYTTDKTLASGIIDLRYKTEKEKRKKETDIEGFSLSPPQTYKHTDILHFPPFPFPQSLLPHFLSTRELVQQRVQLCWEFPSSFLTLIAIVPEKSLGIPNIAVQWLALLPEVPNSNLGSETGNPEVIFLRPSKKMLG